VKSWNSVPNVISGNERRFVKDSTT